VNEVNEQFSFAAKPRQIKEIQGFRNGEELMWGEVSETSSQCQAGEMLVLMIGFNWKIIAGPGRNFS